MIENSKLYYEDSKSCFHIYLVLKYLVLEIKMLTYQNEFHFQSIFFIEPNLRNATQVTVD